MKITSPNRAFVFGALFSLTASLANAAGTAAAKQVQAGEAALKSFDLPNARAAFGEAYRLDPNNYTAAWKYARALADTATLTTDHDNKKKLIVECERAARKAVELNSNDSAGHTSVAIAVGQLALLEGGKRKVQLSKEVRDECNRALELNPDDDIAGHVLAVWNREMTQLNWMLRKVAELLYGRFPPASLANAHALLEHAVKVSPNNVAHHVELGLTHVASRDYKKAEAEFTQALALPQSWVTDSIYRAKAEAGLKDIARHLK